MPSGVSIHLLRGYQSLLGKVSDTRGTPSNLLVQTRICMILHTPLPVFLHSHLCPYSYGLSKHSQLHQQPFNLRVNPHNFHKHTSSQSHTPLPLIRQLLPAFALPSPPSLHTCLLLNTSKIFHQFETKSHRMKSISFLYHICIRLN